MPQKFQSELFGEFLNKFGVNICLSPADAVVHVQDRQHQPYVAFLISETPQQGHRICAARNGDPKAHSRAK